MKLLNSFLFAAVALTLTVFTVLPATAGITSVDTTQNRVSISATAPSTISVTWRIVRDPGSAAPGTAGPGSTGPNPGTVSSPRGTLLVNGVTVATISQTLSRSAPGTTPAAETLIITETFTVPQAAAFRAIKAGVPIVYQRTFTDTGVPPGPASGTGNVLLSPTGPGSEPFSVSRLELRFDDNSQFKVLPKNRRLRAIARLNTTGSGPVRGEWQVATASTTAGTPVFRTLALVRQPVAGGRRVVITSPPLPTRFEGNNLVRLRLTDPDPFFEEPLLQYYVTPESPLPEQQEARPMLVTAPSPGTPLTQTTRFAWQAIPGTHAYKLEIFGARPGPADNVATSDVTTDVPLDPTPDAESIQGLRALTGAVVPGAITEARLQDYTLAHLPGDRRYQWSVKALDEDGAVIGRSPAREIYKP